MFLAISSGCSCEFCSVLPYAYFQIVSEPFLGVQAPPRLGIGSICYGNKSSGAGAALSMLTMLTVPCGLCTTAAAASQRIVFHLFSPVFRSFRGLNARFEALLVAFTSYSWQEKVTLMLWVNASLFLLFFLYAFLSSWPGFYQRMPQNEDERRDLPPESPA